MTTLTEELRERARKEKPDEFTLAWWGDRFDSMQQVVHGQNAVIAKQAANLEDAWKEVIRLRDENARMAKAIGELQTSFEALSKRVSDMAKWAAAKDKQNQG